MLSSPSFPGVITSLRTQGAKYRISGFIPTNKQTNKQTNIVCIFVHVHETNKQTKKQTNKACLYPCVALRCLDFRSWRAVRNFYLPNRLWLLLSNLPLQQKMTYLWVSFRPTESHSDWVRKQWDSFSPTVTGCVLVPEETVGPF